MPLQFINGKLLFTPAGKLAMDPNCCCGGTCTLDVNSVLGLFTRCRVNLTFEAPCTDANVTDLELGTKDASGSGPPPYALWAAPDGNGYTVNCEVTCYTNSQFWIRVSSTRHGNPAPFGAQLIIPQASLAEDVLYTLSTIPNATCDITACTVEFWRP